MTITICRKLEQQKKNLEFVSVYFWQIYIGELRTNAYIKMAVHTNTTQLINLFNAWCSKMVSHTLQILQQMCLTILKHYELKS